MQISCLSGINFGAKLRSKTEIMKFNDDKERYEKVPASFVEVSPYNSKDLSSVSDAVSTWAGDLYGMNVVYTMERLNYASRSSHSSDKFYAVTTQNDNFESLDPDKIEAITHVKESDDSVDITNLQVNPYLVYVLGNPEYKHVGKGMIDGLKRVYNDKPLLVKSSVTATGFYERQGFKRTEELNNDYIYSKEAV